MKLDKATAGVLAQQFDRFEDAPSVGARFPNLKGILLQQALHRDYVIESSRTIPYFTSQGKRAINRHALNDRDVQAHVDEMVDAMLGLGYLRDVSGSPVCVQTDLPEEFGAVAAASRVDAVYLANERAPDNENIQATISQGK